MGLILLPSSDQMAELEELKPIRHHTICLLKMFIRDNTQYMVNQIFKGRFLQVTLSYAYNHVKELIQRTNPSLKNS